MAARTYARIGKGGGILSRFRWPLFFAVLVSASVLGAIVGGLRVRYRPVEGTDLSAPPGYRAATQLGDLKVGQLSPGGNAVVLAAWVKPGDAGGLWVSRMNEDKMSFISGGTFFLDAFERGMRQSAEKHGRAFSMKHREMREIAGRKFAFFEAMHQTYDLRIVVIRIGRSELLLNANAPDSAPDLHVAGFDALTDQVARLESPETPRAERTRAAGKGAGIGFGAALLPAIFAGTILRRRR
jgi:hypothetical protein